MTIYGKCKYCGNPRIVEGADGSEPQSIRDEWATEQCDCTGAETARKRAADRKTAEEYIDNLVDDQIEVFWEEYHLSGEWIEKEHIINEYGDTESSFICSC